MTSTGRESPSPAMTSRCCAFNIADSGGETWFTLVSARVLRSVPSLAEVLTLVKSLFPVCCSSPSGGISVPRAIALAGSPGYENKPSWFLCGADERCDVIGGCAGRLDSNNNGLSFLLVSVSPCRIGKVFGFSFCTLRSFGLLCRPSTADASCVAGDVGTTML